MDTKSRLTASIWPWGTKTPDQMREAAKEISEIGYKHFESTKDAIHAFNMELEPYKAVLDEFGITPVSFYFHLPPLEEEEAFFEYIETEMDFIAKLGVKRISLQATLGRPEGNVLSKEQLEAEAALITRFAKKSKEYGITSNLHPHHNTWAMYENEIDYFMQNIDEDILAFCPDTAHLIAGNCDPVEVIKRYAHRVNFTHFKDIKNADVASEGIAANGVEVYSNFCELGKGSVDFAGVFAVLKEAGYDGPLCEELDMAPVSNKESAKNNYDFLLNNW